jgi:serine protease AprX
MKEVTMRFIQQRFSTIILLIILCLLVNHSIVVAESVLKPEDRNRVVKWVFLDRKDKSPESYHEAESQIDEKTRARRVRATGLIVTEGDLLPLAADLEAIEAAGAKIRVISRWLNAVSIEISHESLQLIEKLEFVNRVTDVARGKREIEISPALSMDSANDIDPSIYGDAWVQDSLVHVPAVHDMGYTGEGVRIGFLDAGFINYTGHQAFANLIVAGTYNTHDQSSNVEEHSHGVKCMSVVAAKDTNNFIGVAPDVEVLLIVTEDADAEYQGEEDFWIAGLEWAEAHGADIISSSLSYLDWYVREDMDGNTAPITIAADLAAGRGLLVVNSAGNHGEEMMGAPADGDSVLTVGATDYAGQYVAFSSQGPTADGRIKPNVAAMGQGVSVIDYQTNDGYTHAGGTSYSCPTVAGIVALMLQANPDLLPMDILTILQETANNSANPDNLLGYGVVNAEDAVLTALSSVGENALLSTPDSFVIHWTFPNPTNAMAKLGMNIKESGTYNISIYDLLGRLIKSETINLRRGVSYVNLDMNSYSTGTYLYDISKGNLNSSGKLTVIK